MDEETTIAQGLHVTDDCANLDAACKRVLSEKSILARVMKASLKEYENCDVKEIEEKYIEGTPQVGVVPVRPDESGTVISGMDTEDKSVHEGAVTYDIRFRAIVPGTGERVTIIINVEVQNDFYPGYPLIMRAVYYCCRMISAQYGREFTNSHYEKIKKVCSIWICTKPPKYRANTITRYRLVEENLVGEAKEPVKNYDLMTIVFICLGGPVGENYDGILRMLDVLLSSETGEAEKRRILQDEYDIPMTQTMTEEVSRMCDLSRGVMEKGIAKGRAEGRAEGIVEGMEKGMTKGKAEGFLSAIRGLVASMGWSVEQAMDALRLSDNDRATCVELLRKQ